MTTRYEKLEELGEGVEGPRRWLPFQPDESMRPRAHLGVDDRRPACAPPKGYRRDANGALHLTPWKPPPMTAARKAEAAKYRLPDGPDPDQEEHDMPGTPTPASDKRPIKNRQPSPNPPSKNPFDQKIKPSTPEAGFGDKLTAAEKRALKAAREKAAVDRAIEAVMQDRRAYEKAKQDADVADELAHMAAKGDPIAKAALTPKTRRKPTAPSRPTGQTLDAAVNLLRHDPDYLGDITLDRLNDLLGVEDLKKYHPRIRREIKSRKAAA